MRLRWTGTRLLAVSAATAAAARLLLLEADGRWRLADPELLDAAGRPLWSCRLRRPGEAGDGWFAWITAPAGRPGEGTDPDRGRLALLAPPEAQAAAAPPGPGADREPGAGRELELGVDPRRCRLVQPARLRARLLEFLKFRVLAAQEQFDADLRDPGGTLDPERVRPWLRPLWPEALDLDDGELTATLEQARRLYTEI